MSRTESSGLKAFGFQGLGKLDQQIIFGPSPDFRASLMVLARENYQIVGIGYIICLVWKPVVSYAESTRNGDRPSINSRYINTLPRIPNSIAIAGRNLLYYSIYYAMVDRSDAHEGFS